MLHKVECLEVTLTIEGPLLTQASTPGPYGVDSCGLRDPAGNLVITDTLIKGRLLEALEELGVDFGEWLGSENPKEPRSARLIFVDAIGPRGKAATRSRIRIDDETGSVVRGALQVIEAPLAAGERSEFTGRAFFFPERAGESARETLELGLRWVSGFGALKGVGYGRNRGVRVTAGARPGSTVDVRAADSERLHVELRLGAPYCNSRLQPVQNLFESADIITGAALKGAVAATWRARLGLPPSGAVDAGTDPDRRELGEQFEHIRFSHLFPAAAAAGKRPVAPPLSLCEKPDEGFFDLATHGEAVLLQAQPNPRAPAFRPDWKDEAEALSLCGWAKPHRKLRVRTAISREHRRAADEKLFAYEMLHPEEEICWFGEIDLAGVDETAHRQLLEVLAGGVYFLGKTKCPVDLVLDAPGRWQPAWGSRASGEAPGIWYVTLQTSAMLLDPEATDFEKTTAAGLKEAYAGAWRDLSGGALELDHHYAQQELAGGSYFRGRFQAGRDYYPYLLTSAGSVFALHSPTGRSEEARAKLAQWERHGLAWPRWMLDRYQASAEKDRWRRCPYVPENGWGEIAVNCAIHFDLAPGASQLAPVAVSAPGGER